MQVVGAGWLFEMGSAGLVYYLDLTLRIVGEGHDVALGAFADGYDLVSLAACGEKFSFVEISVYALVIFWMAHEDEVVYGHDAFDATIFDAYGQFAGETMEDVHAVGYELLRDATMSPPVFLQAATRVFWIAKRDVVGLAYLCSQVFMPTVGGIQPEVKVWVTVGERVDKRAPIVAQARVVAHDALGVKTNGGMVWVVGHVGGWCLLVIHLL